MKRILAKLIGWPGKTTPQKRPSRSCRPAVEQMEARELPVVGAFSIPPEVLPGTGFDGVVKLNQLGLFNGTGTLLADGRHILTAAHVVTDSSGNITNTDVEFDLPGGNVTFTVTAANIHKHPGWNGNLLHGNDLAILDLPSLAPIGAERRDIYRGTDEVGQFFQMVGYGWTGTGDEGAVANTGGTKRKGVNDFDSVKILAFVWSGNSFVFDPTAGALLKFEFDSVQHEDFVAHGDSGGPNLLGGRIAGVNSGVQETTVASILLSGDFESQFGESAYSTRVSSFAGWIDGFTTGNHALVIDMNKQPDGNDGGRDQIDVRTTGGNLEIRVNGRLYLSESAASISSLEIEGSSDDEDFATSGPMGMDVILDGKGGTGAQTLTVLGTNGPDDVTVGPAQVTFGGHAINFSLVDLTVNTLGGSDGITLEGPTIRPVHLLGGADSDTLVSLNGDNQWSLLGTNGGTLQYSTTHTDAIFSDVENLQGGTAVDTFTFGLGSVTGTINGGGGGGTLNYTNVFGSVSVNLQAGTAPFIGGGFANITSVLGSFSGADTLIGRNQPTSWTLTALNAGQIAGSGQGGLSFSGFENLEGGTATDTFTFLNAGGISGDLNGGSGFTFPAGTPSVDTLDYSRRSTGVVVDLSRGLIPGVGQAFGMEGVIGTMKDDLLRGDRRDNILQGGGGFDILIGEDGNDKLVAGNTGRCILIGGRGQDILVGGNPSLDLLTGKPVSDGSDLIIGGRTSFDDDDLALTAIMNEWRRSNRTYAQRVQDLRTGVPVSAGVAASLTMATVLDDGVADQIAGQGGDDWFWGLAIELADRSNLVSLPGKLEIIN